MKLTRLSPTLFMLLLITFCAGAVRFAVVAGSPMPLNDGGLFYQMTVDLQANGYRLPAYTTYNNESLPFAYPPFAFYFGAFGQLLSGLDLLDIIRILPSLISLASIPILYLLTKEITSNEAQAFLAGFLFAFLPLAFSWQIMGGGLTRAPGQVFSLLTLLSALRLYRKSSRPALLLTSVFGSLVVLTHPEAALQSVLAVAVLFLFYGRSWQAAHDSLKVAGMVVIFSAPWWVNILLRFGGSAFLASASAAGQNTIPLIGRLLFLFRLNITEEPFGALIASLGILGFFLSLARRDYLLPAWLLTTILIEPRSGIRFSTIPLSILGGNMLYEIFALLKRESQEGTRMKTLQETILSTPLQRIFFGYLFIAVVTGAFFTVTNLSTNLSVSRTELETIRWIHVNTPITARIATITQERPLFDPFTEWLPPLSKRNIVTSIFGYEWAQSDISFQNRVSAYNDLQQCANQDDTCLVSWMEQHGQVEYFVLKLGRFDEITELPLRVWLLNAPNFTQIYYENNIAIFKVNDE